MKNQMKEKTTEVIIIPNDKMHSKSLPIFRKKCRNGNNCTNELCEFVYEAGNANVQSLSLNNNRPTEEVVSYIVEEGFIVMIYSEEGNILDVYFPSLSMENISTRQLCSFSQELKKIGNVKLVLGYKWDNKASVFEYNDEFSCNFYKEATGREAKRFIKVPSQNKHVCRCNQNK